MVQYFPADMKVFIEPFLGGGSVSLSVADDTRFTKLERMIAGDLYTEMWAFWNGVKKDPAAVEEIATKWFTEKCPTHKDVILTKLDASTVKRIMQNPEQIDTDLSAKLEIYNQATSEAQEFWNWTQTVNTEEMSLEERAARMLLVNKISFSAMGDSGSLSKDQFCGFRLDKLNRVYATSKLLQRIEIYNVSFEETMKYAEQYNPEEVFIFLDPPYFNQESSGLYGKGGNTHKGFPHQFFADTTLNCKANWFVTYDDSVAVRQLFNKSMWNGQRPYFKDFKTIYTMAGKTAEDALAGEELFISNMNIVGDDAVDGYVENDESMDF